MTKPTLFAAALTLSLLMVFGSNALAQYQPPPNSRLKVKPTPDPALRPNPPQQKLPVLPPGAKPTIRKLTVPPSKTGAAKQPTPPPQAMTGGSRQLLAPTPIVPFISGERAGSLKDTLCRSSRFFKDCFELTDTTCGALVARAADSCKNRMEPPPPPSPATDRFVKLWGLSFRFCTEEAMTVMQWHTFQTTPMCLGQLMDQRSQHMDAVFEWKALGVKRWPPIIWPKETINNAMDESKHHEQIDSLKQSRTMHSVFFFIIGFVIAFTLFKIRRTD